MHRSRYIENGNSAHVFMIISDHASAGALMKPTLLPCAAWLKYRALGLLCLLNVQGIFLVWIRPLHQPVVYHSFGVYVLKLADILYGLKRLLWNDGWGSFRNRDHCLLYLLCFCVRWWRCFERNLSCSTYYDWLIDPLPLYICKEYTEKKNSFSLVWKRNTYLNECSKQNFSCPAAWIALGFPSLTQTNALHKWKSYAMWLQHNKCEHVALKRLLNRILSIDLGHWCDVVEVFTKACSENARVLSIG